MAEVSGGPPAVRSGKLLSMCVRIEDVRLWANQGGVAWDVILGDVGWEVGGGKHGHAGREE